MSDSAPSMSDLQARKRAFAIAQEQKLRDLEKSWKPIPDCPLITPMTRFLGIPDEGLRECYAIRKGAEAVLPPMPRLRDRIDEGTPTEQPLRMRGCQKEMVVHMHHMPRFVDGDSVGLGKTLCAIAGTCAFDHVISQQGQKTKTIIFTTTSTAHQWDTEIKRFSTLNPWVLKDAYKFKGDSKITYGHKARMAQLQKFLDHPKLDVLIIRYSQFIGRRKKIASALDADGKPVDSEGKENLSQEIRDFRDALSGIKGRSVLILDETHKIKTPGAQIRNMVVSIQRKFTKVWGLTATAIKNHLEEFYSIMAALGISPLGSLNYFRENYCNWQAIQMGPRTDYKIIGYNRIPEFKVGIRPFYWGRSQAQVKEPLPKLTTLYHPVELSDVQSKLLLEDIPSGTYVLPPIIRTVAGEVEVVERDPSNLMTMLSVTQLVANSPALLDRSDLKVFHSPTLSAKEEVLLDLLDGQLLGEKVIIFTKYRSWIDRLEHLTGGKRFTSRNFLRVTGNEKGAKREKNRQLFQNDPDYDFIAINSAGIEGLNLQQAAHMICLDLPWSWGDLIQLVGRMVRMASPHSACTLHILYAMGTIDEFVIETQRSKKGVFERILGSAGTVGLLDAEVAAGPTLAEELELAGLGLENESDDDFKDLLRAHAKKIGMRPYVTGEILAKQVAGMRDLHVDGRSGRKDLNEEELADRW